MTENFEQNCALFGELWPLEAFHLQSEDLASFDQKLFDGDVKKWVSDLPLEGVQTLLVYGVGFGSAFEHLLPWLKQDAKRHLVFLEDDAQLLRAFFETERATELLSHPQVTLCYSKSAEDSDAVLDFLYWSFAKTNLYYSVLPYYSKVKGKQADKYFEKIHYGKELKDGLVEEYLQFGASFFRNFYSNIKELPESLWGNKLFGKFEGVPAIILGAGPSLSKQIEVLRSLTSRALIFAGGSALNAVKSKGFKPHFGAGIDPNQPQMERLKETGAFPVPFFYRSRLFSNAIREVKGPRLYVSGAGGYDVSEWYEEKLSITSDFLDEGHNVVNFCTELALRLGCNPIIFVGLDLAFTGRQSYAEGVGDTIHCKEPLLMRKDIYGNETTTQWKWIFEADWISQYAKDHPEVSFYNATEGGIGIPGVENIPLKSLSAAKLTKTYPIKSLIAEALKEAEIPHVTPEKVQEATLQLKESLERSLGYIKQLIDEVTKEKEKKNPQDKLVSGKAILLESDLFDEPAYQYILDIFHHVFARLSYKESLILKQNKKEEKNPKELALAKLELQRKKLLFLKDVAEANLLLMQFAESV